jgi:23S rRNA (uracil1939-C5)-methyltransferase
MTPRKQITSQRRARQAAKKHSAARKKTAKKPGISGEIGEKNPSGAKVHVGKAGIMYGLKPAPFTESSSSAACKVSVDSSAVLRGVKPPSSSALRLVEIEKAVYGGAFLARLEGKAVFVPLTLPGEQARIRITQSRASFATAEAEEIVRAVTQRIPPACPHFGACGGCHYQHTDYATQLSFKQTILRETLERGGVAVPVEIAVLSGENWGYRNRIRLAVDAAGNLGYRGRRSHGVVPIHECPIAAPLLVEAALAFAQVAREFAPALRPTEIALFCNREERALLATVFTGSLPKLRFDELAKALHERIPALTGAELVVEGQTGEPPRTISQWGAASLDYPAAGFDYRVDHGAFFQVNRWLLDSLVERVTAGHEGKLAWDLFAGVGLFARRLAASFDSVAAVESAPAARAALEENLRGISGATVHAETLAFLRGNRRGERPDLIVVDPPRTGLGAETCALLGEIATPTLVSVSCDPSTLARDLRALIAFGYRIESVTLADLFPQTFHLETVVQLRLA